MKKYEGFEEAQAIGEFESITPGGYVCRILKVVAEEKDYGTLLRIGFDIFEGEKAGFFKKKFETEKASNPDAKWKGMFYQTVMQKDLRFFKAFITSVEKSNPNWKWNWNENELVNKLVGFVYGEEEFRTQNGDIKVTCKPVRVRSVEEVRKGVEVPPIKKLTASFDEITAIGSVEELPF